MATVDQIAEELARQKSTSDTKFYALGVYMFELRAPAAAFSRPGGDASGNPDGYYNLFFPLTIAPRAISMSEPYTVEYTPGLDGGVFVEENGVLMRKIQIDGTTGLAPRYITATPAAFDSELSVVTTPNRKQVDFSPGVLEKLSGQRHFQFLQEKVFRAYAELKRDGRYAANVQLFFHNLKDSEAWLVVPDSFVLNRQSSSSTLYHYSISLTALEPRNVAKRSSVAIEDKSFWDKVKDVVKSIRQAVARVQAVLNDIVRVADEIARDVSTIFTAIREVVALIDNVRKFIDGFVGAITGLIQQAASVLSTIDSVVQALETSLNTIDDRIVQAWRQLTDEAENLQLTLLLWGESQGERTAFTRAREIANKTREERIRAANADLSAAISTARTSAGLAASGTQPTLADVARMIYDAGLQSEVPEIRGLVERQLGPADTLVSLSAQYLGSGRYWWIIAQLNELRFPYISTTGLPGTIQPGSSLVLPTTAVSGDRNSRGIALAEDDLAAQQFYRDAALARDTEHSNQFDLVLDPRKNNRDVKYVEGVENLQQAITTRLNTIAGENPLYPALGMERVIGLNEATLDAEILRVHVQRALSADSRIQSTKVRVTSGETSRDTYDVDVEASTRNGLPPVELLTVVQI